METYSEIRERLENLNSQLFYNIINSPDCRYEAKFGENQETV